MLLFTENFPGLPRAGRPSRTAPLFPFGAAEEAAKPARIRGGLLRPSGQHPLQVVQPTVQVVQPPRQHIDPGHSGLEARRDLIQAFGDTRELLRNPPPRLGQALVESGMLSPSGSRGFARVQAGTRSAPPGSPRCATDRSTGRGQGRTIGEGQASLLAPTELQADEFRAQTSREEAADLRQDGQVLRSIAAVAAFRRIPLGATAGGRREQVSESGRVQSEGARGNSQTGRRLARPVNNLPLHSWASLNTTTSRGQCSTASTPTARP